MSFKGDTMSIFTTEDAIIELWGHKVVLTSEMQNTMLLFRARQVFDNTVQEFSRSLIDKKLTLRQFCEKESPRVVTEIIFPLCEPFVDLINQAGIYDVDLELFWNKYYVPKYLAPWEEMHEYLVDIYRQMLERGQEEFDLYEAQKQSRAKIKGGGFGLIGAATGIITASAINLFTGMAYDIKNASKKEQTREKMRYVSNNVITHPEIIEKINSSLKASLYNILLAIQEIVEEKTIYKFLELSEDTIYSVDATINTLINLEKKGVEFESETIKLLQTNPYNQRIYHMAISMHGDPEHELDIFADLTGIDIRNIRNKILIDTLPKIQQKFNNPDEKNEFLIEWAMYLGVLEDDFAKIVQWMC